MAGTVARLLLFAELAIAQFVAEPTNFTTKTGYAGVDVRYKEVPAGICEQDPDVKSYSGFADVAEDEHIFWWFFEARNVDPTTAPLTIWINGGPGSSSMIGLFQELGPCGVDYDGNVYDNPYSWSNISNVVFIDQPTTTGLSYSIPVPGYVDPESGDMVALPDATCPDYVDSSACGTYNVYNTSLTANSTTGAAPNFYLTLQAFTGVFPQYSSNGVYFATESYGGHYAPVFSRYIVEQNELNATGTAPIDLRAVLIGNGWYNPILQYAAFYNFTSNISEQTHQGGNTYGVHYNASLDSRVFNSMYGAHNCLDQLIDCNNQPYATYTSDGLGNSICNAADNFCYDQVEYVYDVVFNRDEYDIRYLVPDPFPYTFYVDYLNDPSVQAAIGAYTNYSESSTVTSTAFASTGDDAREMGVTAAVEYLLDHDITVVLYFGDADYVCNWFGGEAFARTLSNVEAYTNGSAGFVNISTPDDNDVVHGQVVTAGAFSFVRIYESGHEVPFYQPLVSLALLNRTLAGVDIATGQIPLTASYITHGTPESTYVNGDATVTHDVLPANATYNTTTNQPNPPYNTTPIDDKSKSKSLTASTPSRLERARADAERIARSPSPSIEARWHRTKRNRKTGRHALFDGVNSNGDGNANARRARYRGEL